LDLDEKDRGSTHHRQQREGADLKSGRVEPEKREQLEEEGGFSTWREYQKVKRRMGRKEEEIEEGRVQKQRTISSPTWNEDFWRKQ